MQKVFGKIFNAGTEFEMDGSQFDRLFAHGDVFAIGNLDVSVMHTPGHTPACVTYVTGDAAFIGDTLFMPDFGTARADFPGGSATDLYASIQRILALPDETRLFLCHDYKTKTRDTFCWQTTVAEQKTKNVHVGGGKVLTYDYLVVAAGLKLDWSAIEGLETALGKNGVTSNYRYDLAPYTWELVQKMRGKEAIFTQSPMPIKCAGAPQKAMYLSCSTWTQAGKIKDFNVSFCNAGPVLFGCADYVPPLMECVDRYGINLDFGYNLVKVDGPNQTATFKVTKEGEYPQLVERKFDMLHVCPPQCAPDFLKESPLANEGGWMAVDQATLQSTIAANVFGLGDVTSTPNAKTAAAARKQAPIVADNLIAQMKNATMPQAYDGYGSCPLTVEHGKIILAEFGYGGKLMPSFPLDSTKPRRAAWFLKKSVLP